MANRPQGHLGVEMEGRVPVCLGVQIHILKYIRGSVCEPVSQGSFQALGGKAIIHSVLRGL